MTDKLGQTLETEGKIQICLHPLKIRSKAEATDKVGKITTELSQFEMKISLLEFAQAVGNGQTWSGGMFDKQTKCAKNWKKQQVFAIDVDNNDKIVDIYDLYAHYKAQNLPPNLGYFSLSSTDEKPKYRLIWALAEPVYGKDIALGFKRWLIFNSMQAADSCTINLDRLYFGGKNPIVFDDELIPVESIPTLQQQIKKRKKRTAAGFNMAELRIALKYVRSAIEDPANSKYITRYKTVFNGAVYLFTASNGSWDVDKVWKFIHSCQMTFPEHWESYHHTEDEMYSWVEKAEEWTHKEIL